MVRRPFLEDDRAAVAVADEEAVTLRGEAPKNRGCESAGPLGYSSVGAFFAVSPLRKAVGTEWGLRRANARAISDAVLQGMMEAESVSL